MKTSKITQMMAKKILSVMIMLAFLAELFAPALVKADSDPNDPSFGDQWGLSKVQAAAAWEKISGSTDIVVAIIDTGIDYQHEDLADNIWKNEKEIAGNGIDDDKNGFIDDISGWDFFNKDNDPRDDNGHGTHLAGIIGAAVNNKKGITGIGWNPQIMPLKCLGANSQGALADAASGIRYAVDNGAQVINISWSAKRGSDKEFSDALKYAYQKNVTVIASAGNDNDDADEYFPANAESVITVAATGKDDNRSSFSNQGNVVAISAPGEKIKTTVLGNKYEYFKGTSLSAAFVSGLSALLLAEKKSLNPDEIRIILQNSADDLGDAGWDKNFGAGRVNADKAMKYLKSGQYATDLANLGKIVNNRPNINYFGAGESIKTAGDSSVEKKDSQKKKKSARSGKAKKPARPGKSVSREIKNSAGKLQRGQILIQSGKKFSKNSLVLAYFSKPGGGYYAPRTIRTDGKGNFAVSYQIWKPAGTYSWFVKDTATGKTSKAISYQVK
jgi:subtilisin family serine protease